MTHNASIDTLETTFRLDHTEFLARTIMDWHLTCQKPLVLDGEVEIEKVYDHLFMYDPSTTILFYYNGGGFITYGGVRIHFGPHTMHPALSQLERIQVGQPFRPRGVSKTNPPRKNGWKSLLKSLGLRR